MPWRTEAGFFPLGEAPWPARLCLWTTPTDRPASDLVVYAHPFTEEMNKSRRMAGLQARALADAGCAVVQIDLLGCGDSAGDFADATWQRWVDDVTAAARWAQARHRETWPAAAAPTLWFWGLRAGCLLATQAAAQLGQPCHFVFWQPATQGKAVLQQFLRLANIGARLGKSAPAAAETPQQALAAGRAVSVAGYRLDPALAAGLQAARLQPPATPGRVEWFELSTQAADGPSPAARQALEGWADAGWSTRHHGVIGPSFWQTTEIEDAPALITQTTAALCLPADLRAPDTVA